MNAIQLFHSIKQLIYQTRTIAANNVNSLAVFTNFFIGKYIVEHEQHGSKRAQYAQKTLIRLSERLNKEFGKGYSERTLQTFRKFYLEYSNRRIPQTLSAEFKTPLLSDKKIKSKKLTTGTKTAVVQNPISQTAFAKFRDIFPLSWSQYVFLMGIDNKDERQFYEIESAQENWAIRELRRQFNSSLYERLALSRNKQKVKDLNKKGHVISAPEDSLKDPYILEFLGLEEKSEYTETELETAIINKLGHFLLEMGKGFLFQARQKRITLEDHHYYIDLVLYNRYLQCFVLIDLKIGEIQHDDLGQMQMYVNYYDRFIKSKEENKTIGIVLCKKQNKALVEITLPENNNQIFARNYQLYFPSKTQLKRQLQKYIKDIEK